MNKIKYIWGLLMLVVLSCTDFVDPAIPYSNFETATYLRTITAPTSVNFFAMGSATFSLTVEAVDAEAGTSVQEVQVFVNRRRGATTSAPKLLTTVPASAFTPEGKYTRTTITVPFTTVLTTMGFTQADMAGGDFVEYRLSLLTKNGRTFTNTNLSPDVSGGEFYRSPFFYRVALVCPSDLAGTYSYVTTNVECANCGASSPGAAACAPSVSGTGTFTASGSGRYAVSDATFGQYACAWSDNPATGVIFVDACNKVSTAGSDQYGLIYTFLIVSNTGTALTIDWSNDYGDAGRTVLTRTDSKTWPAGLTN